MVNKLTHKIISNFSYKFNKNKTNKIIKNINTKTDLINVLLKSDYIQDKKKTYTNYTANIFYNFLYELKIFL